MKTKFIAKFYRHFPAQKSECDILMKVSCTDHRFSYSIGHSINKKDWSDAKQLPKDQIHLTEISDRITSLKEWVKEFAKAKKTIYRDDLKDFILLKDGKKPLQAQDEVSLFFGSVEKIIEDADTEKLLQHNLKPFSKATIKNWRASRNRLMEFNPGLSFSNTDEATYNEFKNWGAAREFGASYIDKLIKDWKSFFKYCGYPAPPFKRLGVREPDKPYLDTREIALLEAVELTGTDEEIRDRYIVNLLTGLRISDMKNLVVERINGNAINFKSTQKTGAPVSIPIAAAVRRILAKYSGQFPPQHHEVVVNRRIKVICGLAGITKPVELKVADINKRLKERLIKEAFMDGSEVTVKIPKNELVTNHTARRSMTTNMLRSGIVINKARKVTGMSLKTLMRYDKITPEENAEDLKSHPFFA